jgi:hypothetical protein
MHEPPRCVIDIEASGLGRHSYPIEVGYVSENGQAWCTLIRPAQDWVHWDPDAERLHGITRRALLQHGRPVREVAQRLNDDLGGGTAYCDGWAHDFAWLGALYEAADMTPRFHLESVNKLLDDGQLARLDRLRQGAFATLGIVRHRASSDARALQWALEQLAA